jgi:hypothetical protein
LSSKTMGSGRKPDALHTVKSSLDHIDQDHHNPVKPGLDSSGSARVSQELISAEHSKPRESQDSMILSKALVSNSKPRNHSLASRRGMISTDIRLRSGEKNVGINRKSHMLDLSFSITKLENDEVKHVVSEITKQVVSEITKQVDSETKSNSDASKKKLVESLPESNLNLESLNAKMDRLAAELRRTQVEIMRYRNIHLVPSEQANHGPSKQTNLVPSKQSSSVSSMQSNPVLSNPVPNQQTNPVPNKQTNPVPSKQTIAVLSKQTNPVPNKQTNPVPSRQTNPVSSNHVPNKPTHPVSSKQPHPVPSKQTNLVPSKQTNSVPSKQPDDLIQANEGKSDGDAKMADTNGKAARTTVQGKQMLRFGAMDRPQPGSDDNGVYIRREPLHNNPIYISPSNSTPYGRPHYYMNRPDPNRELMEGRGIVVSAWPGMESQSSRHRHSWGYDGENYYSGHHYTRPLFNYSGAQHPYWAYNNHAMRSQPEFFDPDGLANQRLVHGSMPGVFGDRWQKPNDHRFPVGGLGMPLTPTARGSHGAAAMSEEAVDCRRLQCPARERKLGSVERFEYPRRLSSLL